MNIKNSKNIGIVSKGLDEITVCLQSKVIDNIIYNQSPVA